MLQVRVHRARRMTWGGLLSHWPKGAMLPVQRGQGEAILPGFALLSVVALARRMRIQLLRVGRCRGRAHLNPKADAAHQSGLQQYGATSLK
jgi:hypothetical protein